MPIYEYKCKHCGRKFEVRQAMGEDGAKLNCPECDTKNPEKIFSSFFSQGSSATEPFESSCPTCNSGVCGLPQMY